MRVLIYEDVLPRLLSVLGGESELSQLVERTCVVRELRGRVRLVCEGKQGVDGSRLRELGKRLSGRLSGELGWWYVPEVLIVAGKQKNPIGALVLGSCERWPSHWPTSGRARDGGIVPVDTQKLFALQAVLSKGGWITQVEVQDPWPLTRDDPAVLTFFSFKGGVGRTTSLAVVAWQLARAGKRVVAIDLDLEAPGLGQALGIEADRGVVDFLLTSLAAGRVELDPDLFQEAQVHGARIEVLPSGRLGRYYPEKLARLDFSAHELRAGRADEGAHAPQHYLTSLLRHLKERPRDQRPDYVLLDSRAGLHDIGGLALHDLSHVAVLVGRNNRQGLAGLDTTLAALGRRRAQKETRRIVVVQSYAAIPADSDEGRADRSSYREAVYQLACEHLYADDGEPPGLDETDAAHYPWAIGQYDELPKADGLHKTSLAVLENDDFTALRRRIEAIALPEDEDDNDDEGSS